MPETMPETFQVDFYQLSHDPAEKVVPAIAQRLLDGGDRLIVIDRREGALDRLSRALWSYRPESFLAHGRMGEGDEAIQPILLSDGGEGAAAPANGARHIALTDGQWRDEALSFTRIFYFFDEAGLDGARACWRMVKALPDAEPRFWRQDGRRWVQAA